MFLYKRPVTAVLAGLATALIGVALNTLFANAWMADHIGSAL